MQIRRKGRNPLSTKNSNKDTEKLGKTEFSGFMVTVAPDEHEDPILYLITGNILSSTRLQKMLKLGDSLIGKCVLERRTKVWLDNFLLVVKRLCM